MTPQADPVTGKRRVAFRYRLGLAETALPCGQCIGCRLDYSRDWAMRIMHEAALHPVSWFVTLTYDEDHLPPRGELVKTDVSAFMKRLRKQQAGNHAAGISFYACGEYGDTTWRPHYHLALFGAALPDLAWLKNTPGGQLYTSLSLERLWPHGLPTVSALTWETAAYISRYVTKKINGEKKAEHYRRVDPDTGELYELPQEFSLMSRRPAIGKGWMDKYQSDAYPSDFITVGGTRRGPPPRYYDKALDKIDPALLELVKAARVTRATSEKQQANNTPARLAVRETVARARINLRKRNVS